jgi:hypothetical protein
MAVEDADGKAADEASAVPSGRPAPKLPMPRFARRPIPGTDLTIRASSHGEYMAILEDAGNGELDDREVTVRAVHRQLDGDVAVEEVRAWPDERILLAADICIPLEVRADVKPPTVDDDSPSPPVGADVGLDDMADPATEPRTFASFRELIREDGRRRAERWQKTRESVLSIGTGFTLGRELTAQMKEIQEAMDLGLKKSGLSDLDSFKDAVPGLDVSRLAGLKDLDWARAGLRKGLFDEGATEELERLRRTLATPPIEPHRSPVSHFEPIPVTRPEVDLLEEVAETLVMTHDHVVRTSGWQFEQTVEQTRLQSEQREELRFLKLDIEGQKLSRRVTLATAVVAAIAGVAATILAVFALLYAAGIWKPVGSSSSPSPSPTSSEATPAPSAAASSPTPTMRPTVRPTVRPTATPVRAGPTPGRSGA